MALSNDLDPSVDHNGNDPEHFLLHHHSTVESLLPRHRRRQAPHQAIRITHHDHDVGLTLKPASPLLPVATCVRPNQTRRACLIPVAIRFLCLCPLSPASTYIDCLLLQQVSNVGGHHQQPTPTTDRVCIDDAVIATVNLRCYNAKSMPINTEQLREERI
ncbi:hypothetical protein ACLOJK_037030 [Asimina triloba]